MPKQTFYNLSEEKQNKIMEAAKNEFSENSFYEASINKIIKDAGISRGSFYQYFDSLEDLFLYLFRQCANRLQKDIKKKIQKGDHDVFEFFVLLFDEVTQERIGDGWKEFVVTTITNMNIKLMRHLEKYILEDNFKPPIDDMDSYLKWDSIQFGDEISRKTLCHLLVNTMVFIVGACMNDMKNKELYRNALIGQYEMIKHGVIK